MSLLNTIGGLSGGLGSSGGVGGSIPSNQSAADSAASVSVNPSVAVERVAGENTIGPFSIHFPGIDTQGGDSINAPSALQRIIPSTNIVIALVVVATLGLMVWFAKGR